MAIPGVSSRRSSFDSSDDHHLVRPIAPFMANGGSSSAPNSAPNSVYRAGTQHQQQSSIPRNPSSTFRAPFLSPASRPSSSLWSPPSYPQQDSVSPSVSSSALATKLPNPSTRLPQKLSKQDKPWLTNPAPRERLAYYLTLLGIIAGIAGAALLCFFGVRSVDRLSDSQLCSVLDEEFNSGSLDTSVWKYTVELGGFGNGEFEIMTKSDTNVKVQNGQLYIIPSLTSDSIGGTDSIFDGYTYDLGDDCTTDNATACSVQSNAGTQTVIPPAQSARISTNGTKTIKYGKVEVRAKNPRGDWLWPAIWMLPQDNQYGAWPLSGEIDIMESRGNQPTYPAQGLNFVRSTFNYGPLAGGSLLMQLFGWWETKRGGFSDDFHTYTLEWTSSWIRVFVDSRLQAMLDLTMKKSKDSFWSRGHFPQTAQNGSSEAVVTDPWGSSWSAPFDQDFYLVLDVAVGGTSGWFPDDLGNKPWHDGSATAMYDFAKAQDTWSATWPQSEDDRAMRIDYVKMWQLC